MKSVYFKIGILTFTLFLFLLPISRSIAFRQNDDWVHYLIVESFTRNDFNLHPRIGSTFYVQGLAGMIFSNIFSIEQLPVLTLLVSVLNFGIFSLLLHKQIGLKLFTSVLLGFLLFLNPLHLYSVWGFMTENYFMLFFLSALYFILDFTRTGRGNSFLLSNLFILLDFFVKQYSLVFLAALVLLMLVQKKYKLFVVQLGVLLLASAFYKFAFPLSPIMLSQGPNLAGLLNYKYVFSHLLAFLIYLSAFTPPLILTIVGNFIASVVKSKNIKGLVLFLLLSAFLFIGVTRLFDNKQTFTPLFPYLENVFSRQGFFTVDLRGDSYSPVGSTTLFDVWSFVSLAGLTTLAVSLLLSFRNFLKSRQDFVPVKFPLIFLVLYLGFILTVPHIYDRYLLPLVPCVVILGSIFINRYKLESMARFKVLLFTSVLFLAFIGYQFSAEFILRNNYVWSKSVDISTVKNVQKDLINPGHSWRMVYNNGVEVSKWNYIFRYDSPATSPGDEYTWKLIETKKLAFPLSLYNNSFIYLYERGL